MRAETLLKEEQASELYKGSLIDYFSNTPDTRIDRLLIEATNIGRTYIPLGADEGISILRKSMRSGLVRILATYDQDIEFIMRLAIESSELNITPTIASEILARSLRRFMEMSEEVEQILEDRLKVLDTIKGPTGLEKAELNEEVSKGTAILLASASEWELANVMRGLLRRRIKPGLIIFNESEPTDEEGVYTIEILANWFKLVGLTPLRLRISGHYNPQDIRRIINAIRPKDVVPIHTASPSTAYRLLSAITRGHETETQT